MGPIKKEIKGSIINCYSDVTGSNACGFSKYLSGGILSNSYSVSKGEKGVLFNQYKSGDLINTYWDSVLTNPVKIPGENLKRSKSMSEDEMKSIKIVANMELNGAKVVQVIRILVKIKSITQKIQVYQKINIKLFLNHMRVKKWN